MKFDLDNAKILVTGANGHIGTNLLYLLVERRLSVRAMVRQGSNFNLIKSLPIEIFKGDVSNAQDLVVATKGIDCIFHLAAPTTLVADLEKFNQECLENLLSACRINGVKRLVYTSSAVTIGFSDSPKVVLNEKSDKFIAASSYHASKRDLEKILNEQKDNAIEIIIVNPTTVVGRFDSKITPSTMPVERARFGAHRFWINSGITVAPVQNVARGHILAMERGVHGERYILGGENISIKSYFTLLNQLNMRNGPHLKIPNFILYAAGLLFSFVQLLGYDRVPFDFKRIRLLLGHFGFYSSEKAQQKLGYVVGSAQEAVLDYYNWIKTLE